MKNIIKKGFTLIELLVVIGILAVLMAGIVALIDPVDKNRAAQDSKIQSDIGQVATALQSYVASNAAGTYPATGWAAMSTAIGPSGTGELTIVPSAPSGYAAYTYTLSGTTACLVGQLESKKYVNTAAPAGCGAVSPCYWKWVSTAATPVVTTSNACP